MEGSWGSFVSRKNESVLIVEPGEGGGGGGWGVICLFLSVEPGTRGYLSLGIMILSVESEIGVIVSNDSKCRTRETGVTVSRNSDSNCRTWGTGIICI